MDPAELSMKINVGAGWDPQPGYVNVDLYYPADVKDDARTLAGFADGCAAEVQALHVLEHLGREDGRRALAAWLRVLEPGGKLVIVVPDVARMIRMWLEFYDARDARVWEFRSMAIWGNQLTEGEYHKWGYDLDSLTAAVEAAGFRVTSARRVKGRDGDFGEIEDACIRVEAVKP